MTLRVRGIVLESTLLYLRARLSPAEQASVRNGLDAECLALVDGIADRRAWYPAAVLVRLMEACAAALPQDPEETYWRMGRQSCDDTLTAVYRLMSRFSNPEFILRRAVRLWNDYYDRGEFEVLETLPESGAVRVTGAGFSHPALCRRIGGWIERAVEITGGREVEVEHPACALADGGEAEEWRARWKL